MFKAILKLFETAKSPEAIPELPPVLSLTHVSEDTVGHLGEHPIHAFVVASDGNIYEYVGASYDKKYILADDEIRLKNGLIYRRDKND